MVKRSLENEENTNKVLITDFFNKKEALKTNSSEIETKIEEKSQILHKNDEKSIENGVNSEKSNGLITFNKEKWVESLSDEERELLSNEIETIDLSWLTYLHTELTKPYFLQLKRFLKSEIDNNKTIFPPSELIYSWSRLTPLNEVKCLILGQDPYHNHNQAHGLAFSVLEPTRPPPSLINIYKAIAIDYSEFKIPNYKELVKEGKPGGGDLSKWAKLGVLMLNACLTVEAHKANSHAKKGWEMFTDAVLKVAIDYHKSGFVIMAWGTPAQVRVNKLKKDLSKFLVLKTVHPSPLSARRGFFTAEVFKKCNQWLKENGKDGIDWGLKANNVVV